MENQQTEKPKNWFRKHPILSTIFGLVGLLILIGVFSGNSSNTSNSQPSVPQTNEASAPVGQSTCSSYGDNKSIKQNSVTVNYKELNKNPDSFTGKLAKFTGQIVQIQESGNAGILRLKVTKTSYGWSINDIVYIEYQGHTEAVEDDVVSVYGPIVGSKTYTSVANYQITVPAMTGCVIEKISATQNKSVSAPAPKSQTPIETTQPSAPAVATPPPPPPQKTWHTVYTVTTATTENTAPFTIQGSQWRATWNCQAAIWDQYKSAPDVYANPTNGGIPDIVARAHECPSGNISYFYDGPGSFYLGINVYSAATITVTIEDYY